jgi:hypothetical protein
MYPGNASKKPEKAGKAEIILDFPLAFIRYFWYYTVRAFLKRHQ